MANYVAAEISIEDLYQLIVSAFALSPVDDSNAGLVNYAYGVLTDFYSGLIDQSELRELLRPLVTSYTGLWSLMGEFPQAVTTSSNSLFTHSPVQPLSRRLFDTAHEAVSV